MAAEMILRMKRYFGFDIVEEKTYEKNKGYMLAEIHGGYRGIDDSDSGCVLYRNRKD